MPPPAAAAPKLLPRHHGADEAADSSNDGAENSSSYASRGPSLSRSAAAASTLLPRHHGSAEAADSSSYAGGRGLSLSRSASAAWEQLYRQHESLFEDRVMTGELWEQHRRAAHRHRLEPRTLLRVMLGYASLLAWVAVLSVAVGVYDVTLVKRFHFPMLSVTSVQAFFSSILFALTLLLVFKTNSSYARWWEARKDVGQLVSLAHNLARQGVAFFPADQPHLLAALGRWTAAAMWVVKSTVRPGSLLKDELQGVLLPDELAWLLAAPHKPLALGQALSAIVAAADIDEVARSRFDGMLTLYTFEFGACGRIYNTPIPAAYTRHTSRFLACYCFLGLPLMLWPLCGWASPVLAVIIAFLLLGVDGICGQIEEPFRVIAFDAFCAAVQRDVATIMGMRERQPVVVGLTAAAAQAGCVVQR